MDFALQMGYQKNEKNDHIDNDLYIRKNQQTSIHSNLYALG